MTIAFRAAATAGNSSGGNLTINKPTGTLDNDIMVVVLYSEHSSTAWTLPSGWAWWGGATGRANNDGNAWIFLAWKRASGEGANYTFTHAGTAWRIGCIASFSGALISGDPEDSTGPTGNSGTGSSNVLASITTNTANDMLIGGAANFAGENLGVGSSGMSLAGQLGGCGIVYQIQAAAGASGTKTLSDTFDAGSWATWHVAIKPAASGQTAAVNQLTETDTLQAITRTKQKEIGLQSETDTLQAFSRQKTITLGLLTETDTVQTFARVKQKDIGQLESTESLFNFSIPIVYTLGLLTETSELQSFSRSKTAELQILTETQSLFEIARLKAQEIGLLSTNETVQPLTTNKSKSLGLLEEINTLFSISLPGEIIYELGILEETSMVLSIGGVKQKEIGLLSESGQLFTVDRQKIAGLGFLSEASLLFGISGGQVPQAHYVYIIAAESRIFVVPKVIEETIEDRTFVIPAESRVFKVPHD